MSPIAWVLLGLSIGWVTAGVAVAILLGRTAKARDRQKPTPDAAANPAPQQVEDDDCCPCICFHQCAKDPTVIGHQGCMACNWCMCRGPHAAPAVLAEIEETP